MNKHFDDDKDFGRYLKNNLPKAPKDEWFVRKTINRLPPEQRRIFGTAEIVSYIAVVAVLACWGYYICSGIISSQMWTTYDLINCALFVLGWIVLTCSIMARVVRS